RRHAGPDDCPLARERSVVGALLHRNPDDGEHREGHGSPSADHPGARLRHGGPQDAAHRIPPAPIVTPARYGPPLFFGRVGVRVYWEGSAGAKVYGVDRAPSASGPWTNVCNRCVTDLDDGFVDLGAGSKDSWYRVFPYSLSGVAGPPSRPF